jgi:hypothetical protein
MEFGIENGEVRNEEDQVVAISVRASSSERASYGRTQLAELLTTRTRVEQKVSPKSTSARP